jgi:hypothetical protein
MMTPGRRAVLALLGALVMLAGAAWLWLSMLAGVIVPYILSMLMMIAGGVIIVTADPASYTFQKERWTGTMNTKIVGGLAVLLFCAGAFIAGAVIVSGVLAEYAGASTMFAIAMLLLVPATIGLMALLWMWGKGDA